MRPWLFLVVLAGCRIGFDPAGGDRGPPMTISTVSPVIGATDVLPAAFALAPDGSTVIAGSVNDGSGFDWAVTRLDPRGQVDRSFGRDGATVIDLGTQEDIANAIAIGPGGEIIVVGETAADGTYDSVVARLTPDGDLDGSFGQGGVALFSLSTDHNLDDRALAVAFDGQGRAVVAGYRNRDYPGWEDTYVMRLADDGSLDAAFGAAGIVTSNALSSSGSSTNDFPSTLMFDREGRILVGLTCSYDACLYRYTPEGVPDPSFDTDGQIAVDLGGLDQATSFALDGDDSVLIAGSSLGATERRLVVARVTPAGLLDASFGTSGVVTLDLGDESRAQAIALTDGAIYVAGVVHASGTTMPLATNQVAMLRLSRAGVRDDSFAGTYVLDPGGADVRGLAVDSAGRVALLARASDRLALVRQDPALPWPMAPLSTSASSPFTVMSAAPDLTLTTAVDGSLYSRTQPLRAARLTVTGAVGWTNVPALFIAASELTFTAGASLGVDGEDGGVPTQGSNAGRGGHGASGGGSGSIPYSGYAGFGGRFGRSGQSIGGIGGTGFAWDYAKGFFWGLGGHGGSGRGCCPPRVPGGEAGNGGGGGGGGAWTNYYTGGGGGGGGLVAIVADSITGAGLVTARGGHGVNVNGAGSGGGGGGVIWIATRRYDGQLTVDVSGGSMNVEEPGQAGTARIFQILPDGTLVARAFTDSW